MNVRLFSLAMSEISDRYIDEALSYQAPAKTRHRHIGIRYLLAACLAAILAVTTALAVSAEFREAVFSWVKTQYETFIHYEFQTDAEVSSAPDTEGKTYPRYIISQLPAGYTEEACSYDENRPNQAVVYRSETGQLSLIVVFAEEDGDGNMFVKEEGYTVQQVEVNGVTGDLYLPDAPADSPGLVWTKDNVIFYLGGNLTPEELLLYAEYVKTDLPY